ncbi:MAG TPA: ECF-type sigma factor [Thermoanaerobaculia bacterium]|nr:ECF-type sigma factor [Thermoanaerobaculia bacterium]
MTGLLLAWRSGDESALERLIPLVYPELRRVARRCLRGERAANTLDTTALVHEAYLRLRGVERIDWRDRVHFFAVIARLMRRVLVDEARRRCNQKRGGAFTRVSFAEAEAEAKAPEVNLLALDDALQRLAHFSPRKGQVVEMRFFGGLTIDETAEALGISVDIVKREWRTAKLWLLQDLEERRDGSRALESD